MQALVGTLIPTIPDLYINGNPYADETRFSVTVAPIAEFLFGPPPKPSYAPSEEINRLEATVNAPAPVPPQRRKRAAAG